MPDLLGSVIAMMLRLRDFSNILALCKLSAKSKYVCLNELFLNHLTILLNKLENETRSKNTMEKFNFFAIDWIMYAQAKFEAFRHYY